MQVRGTSDQAQPEHVALLRDGYRLGLCRRSGGDQEACLAAADGVGRRVTELTVARALAGAACEEKWGPLGSLAEGGRGPCFSTWGRGVWGGGVQGQAVSDS